MLDASENRHTDNLCRGIVARAVGCAGVGQQVEKCGKKDECCENAPYALDGERVHAGSPMVLGLMIYGVVPL